MNYKEAGLTREQREQMQIDIQDLRPYLMALKLEDLGVLKCETCGITDVPYDLHHARYSLDVSYYDLQLLCSKCHYLVTDYRPMRNR